LEAKFIKKDDVVVYRRRNVGEGVFPQTEVAEK
jgi:hypothetical protein